MSDFSYWGRFSITELGNVESVKPEPSAGRLGFHKLTRVIQTSAFAIESVLDEGSCVTQFEVLAIALIFMYMVLLPSLGVGRVTVQALQYLTPLELVFSILLGSLLSLVTVMDVYTLRKVRAHHRSVVIAIFAGIQPAILATFARPSPALYAIPVILLVCSLGMIARDIAKFSPPRPNRGSPQYRSLTCS